MSLMFKVWSATRKQKISLVIMESDNMISELITKSNIKLGINGITIVLEKDGTVIDDDNVLKFCSNEILLLLQPEECWSPPQHELHSMASCDTLSVHSSLTDSPSFSSSSSPRLDLSPKHVSRAISQFNTEETWTNFCIPWESLEPSVLKELEAGNRNKYVINAVIKRVVSEMRNIQEIIPTKVFKIVAQKIIEKHPEIFKDIDEDEKCFGDGTHTTFVKLRDRNCYLNRPHMKRSLSRSLNIPLKKQRKVLSAKAGCRNWQPEKYVESETENTIQDKTEFLRQVVLRQESLQNDSDSQDKIFSYLEATYPAQRLFLNNVHKPPTIQDIKTTWPILLQKKYMFWHYGKLMGHSIDVLKTEMVKKQAKVITFGRRKKYETIINSTDPMELQAIHIILKHFREDNNILFKKYPEGTLLDEIEASIAAPCVIIIDDAEHRIFYLFMEYKQIEITHCFYEALQMLMSAYFIFNMEYPIQCACTLECLQRYFLNIHPSSGTKSRKVITFKVLTFYNKLRDIESEKENIVQS